MLCKFNTCSHWLKETHKEKSSFGISEWWSLTLFVCNNNCISQSSKIHQGYLHKRHNLGGENYFDIPKFTSTLMSNLHTSWKIGKLFQCICQAISGNLTDFLGSKPCKQKLLKVTDLNLFHKILFPSETMPMIYSVSLLYLH